MHSLDELLTYSEGDRRHAWEFYSEYGEDFQKPRRDLLGFMGRWVDSGGDYRLMALIRRAWGYYEVDPTDLKALRAKLDGDQ